MRKQLLPLLAEPGTGAPLRLEATVETEDHVSEGELVSLHTGRRYPITRGIPRFVPDESYTGSFGRQWNTFRTVQLDSESGGRYSQRRFDSEAGWSREDLAGKWLLDAGCGAGRFAEIAASRGANVVALDFSSAVEAAAETLGRFPNTDVVQADLLRPPFAPQVFDYAYCIGVIQHTPDPKKALSAVVRCVREKGHFSFTIYARRPWTLLNGKYLLRPITRRLPQETLLQAIEKAMPVIFPVTDRLFRVPLLGQVARFVIPVATYTDRGEFTEEQRRREAILDTFDMLSPRYDAPMTWKEVATVLDQAGASSFHFRSRVPINVVGSR